MTSHLTMPRSAAFRQYLLSAFTACVLTATTFPCYAADANSATDPGYAPESPVIKGIAVPLPPDDTLARFKEATTLLRQGRLDAAQAIYLKLSEDRPDLAEPWNNLAVIAAQQNRLAEAREMLEMALRVNPALVTAHENLGDLYVRLAINAYGKARPNSTARTKLNHLKTLLPSP